MSVSYVVRGVGRNHVRLMFMAYSYTVCVTLDIMSQVLVWTSIVDNNLVHRLFSLFAAKMVV